MAAERKYSLKNSEGIETEFIVHRDKRLRKTSRWEVDKNGTIIVRIPNRFPSRRIGSMLQEILKKAEAPRRKARGRTDAELQARAEYLNRKYFKSKIDWAAIKWVNNMKTRLGSCTNGGPTDGHIRISSRIKQYPQWVIDYVICHEMAHRVHSNHSRQFWAYLEASYPKTERARGFLEGAGFAEGNPFSE